jgi:hypothetical protein
MAFTVEEINALQDSEITPEMESALFTKFNGRFTNHLTSNGNVVKPKTEYDNEFATELGKKQKEWADSEAPKFYGSMDKMLAAVGMPKPDGMQTRVWVDQLSREGKLPFTAEQIKKLETVLKGEGGGSEADKALYKTLKEEFDQYKQNAENQNKDAFKKLATKATKESLKLAPLNIDSAIKDDKKAEAKKEALTELQEYFEFKYEAGEDEDGTMFYKKKGTTEPIMDTATGEPMTALEIIRKYHPNMLAKESHQQSGVGSQQSKGKTSASTEQQIHEAAAEKGFRKFSPEWKAYVEEEKKKLK